MSQAVASPRGACRFPVALRWAFPVSPHGERPRSCWRAPSPSDCRGHGAGAASQAGGVAGLAAGVVSLLKRASPAFRRCRASGAGRPLRACTAHWGRDACFSSAPVSPDCRPPALVRPSRWPRIGRRCDAPLIWSGLVAGVMRRRLVAGVFAPVSPCRCCRSRGCPGSPVPPHWPLSVGFACPGPAGPAQRGAADWGRPGAPPARWPLIAGLAALGPHMATLRRIIEGRPCSSPSGATRRRWAASWTLSGRRSGAGRSRAGVAQGGALDRTGPLSPDPRGPGACQSHPGEHGGAGGFTGAVSPGPAGGVVAGARLRWRLCRAPPLAVQVSGLVAGVGRRWGGAASLA